MSSRLRSYGELKSSAWNLLSGLLLPGAELEASFTHSYHALHAKR